MSTPTADELRKLKVADLKEKIIERGLEVKGRKKEELVEQLLSSYGDVASGEGADQPAQKSEEPENGGSEVEKQDEGGTGTKAPMTEAEKQKLRAERFGLSSVPAASADKKASGGAVIGGLGMFDPAEELERRKKRAERFGLPPPTLQAEEDAKKKARAERFGIEVPLSKEDIEAKKRERAERFGMKDTKTILEEEEKKKEARAKRFAGIA